MGYFKWADRQLQDLLAKNPTYQRSAYPGMQMGLATQTLNSRIPGADRYARNIMSSGQTAVNNASRFATDASQLLAANAGIQGQTDQQLGDLQLQEADWKKFGLGQLNDAYGAMANEDRYVNEMGQQNFQNEVSLKGAQAANKFAKRKALWNTVGGIANLGLAAFTGGASSAAAGIGKMFGGGGGAAASGGGGISTGWGRTFQ